MVLVDPGNGVKVGKEVGADRGERQGDKGLNMSGNLGLLCKVF